MTFRCCLACCDALQDSHLITTCSTSHWYEQVAILLFWLNKPNRCEECLRCCCQPLLSLMHAVQSDANHFLPLTHRTTDKWFRVLPPEKQFFQTVKFPGLMTQLPTVARPSFSNCFDLFHFPFASLPWNVASLIIPQGFIISWTYWLGEFCSGSFTVFKPLLPLVI